MLSHRMQSLRMTAKVLVGYLKREIRCHLLRSKEIKNRLSKKSKSRSLRRTRGKQVRSKYLAQRTRLSQIQRAKSGQTILKSIKSHLEQGQLKS